MIDVHGPPVTSLTAQNGVAPPRIIWVDLSRIRRPRIALNLFLTTPLVLVGGVGSMALSAVLNSEPLTDGRLAFCYFITALWASTTLLIFAVLHHQWRSERNRVLQSIRSRVAMSDGERAEAILKIHARLVTGMRHATPNPKVIERFRRTFGPGVVIVDDRLRDHLASDPPMVEFVEPAPLLNRPNKLSRITIFGVCGAVLMGFILIANTVQARRLDFSNLAFLAAYWWAIVIAARRFGWRLGEDSAPVAGMGGFSDRRGRRWVAGKSWILVSKWRRGPFVEFFNEHEYFPLVFDSVDNEGFMEWWRRWNHPRPRPDLL